MPSVTTVLAVWGALVSTAAMAWNIARDLNDRGRLRVTCYIAEIKGSIDPADQGSKLAYNVVNTGRRPILVTHIGGAIRKDAHFMITTRGVMPRMLQPGEYLLEYSNDLSVLDDHPQALWVIDSTHRYWKAPRKQLRRLLKGRASKKQSPAS